LPEPLDLAARAVRLAGPDALALVTRERSLLLRFAANRPTQTTAVDDVTVELAVVANGHVGRATTNAADDESLRDVARRASLAAVAASAVGDGPFPGFPDPASAAAHDGHDPSTAALDATGGGDALRTTFAVARASGLEAHGIWTAGEEERAVATSGGEAAVDRITDAYMKVICMDRDGGRSGFDAQTAVAAGRLDPLATAERAAAKAAARGKPTELEPGEYPVVFEPHAVGDLCDLLGFTALNGLAHAEGRGALSERMGQRVAAPSINLSDSPRLRGTIPRAFDADGVSKAPLPLIQDGVAHRVVHDLRSAAIAGTSTTGHSLAPGGSRHGPHPTNLVLAGGGAADEAELCAGIERGVYVTRLWYANVVRPKETLVTAVTRDGTFLIEDGRVTRPLHDLRLTDSVLGILSRTKDLTRDQKLTTDGEFYGRRFAWGVACPALHADAVRFTGPAGLGRPG
jgi:PmbA protein